jgi:WD40 repeat protein
MSGSYPWDSNQPSSITISPDGKVVALSQDKSLAFYSVLTGSSAGTVVDVHTEPVTQVIFSSASDLVFTCGDRHVRVFHNVPGMRSQIQVQGICLAVRIFICFIVGSQSCTAEESNKLNG